MQIKPMDYFYHDLTWLATKIYAHQYQKTPIIEACYV